MGNPLQVKTGLLSCGISVMESFYVRSLVIQMLLELLPSVLMDRLLPAVVGTKQLKCGISIMESYYALYLDTNLVLTIAISPDGQTLISGSRDKTAKIWKLSTGSLIGTLFRHSDWVLLVLALTGRPSSVAVRIRQSRF